MKRYYNKTTGEWYYEGQNMTRSIGSSLFSGVPTAEQLTEWGFEEWVDPEPTPAELLERAKAEKIAEIEAYDASSAVNSFDVTISGQTMSLWIDRETRADYKSSIEAAELLGRTEVKPVFGGQEVTLSVQMAKMALAQVQLYANQCYGVTERHKAAVNALETVDAVEAYDFTTGYPEKLTFDVTATA